MVFGADAAFGTSSVLKGNLGTSKMSALPSGVVCTSFSVGPDVSLIRPTVDRLTDGTSGRLVRANSRLGQISSRQCCQLRPSTVYHNTVRRAGSAESYIPRDADVR